MAAPKTVLTPGGPAVPLTTTGESNGLLVGVNPTTPNGQLIVGFNGTSTSAVVAIRGQLVKNGAYYPVQAINRTTSVEVSNSASISLVNSASVTYGVPTSNYISIEIYCVSGTIDMNVEASFGQTAANAPVIVSSNTSTGTFSGNVTVGGTFGVTGASTLTGDLTESGNAAITGTLAVTGDLTETGNATVGGTLGVTGLLTAATVHTTGAVNMAADVSITQGADLNFVGTTGQSVIHFPDNLASGLVIGEAANAYMTFVSTDSAEAINFGKPTRLPTPTTVVVGGTAISNANAVTEGFTLVTGANNTAAIKLPPTVAGAVCIIKSNTSGSTLQVFPPVNSTINAGAGNAVYNMANLSQRTFVAYNSTAWFTAPETPT